LAYYPSHAVTSFEVEPATTPEPKEDTAKSDADIYFVPAIAGLFALSIVVLLLVALLLIRKRP